jgi:hypothetical protein
VTNSHGTNGDGTGREPVPFHLFRMSASFADVRREFMQEQQAAREQGQPFTVSRRMVLRRMAKYKRAEYRYYTEHFDSEELPF